jgi:hypothetical protein
MKVIHVRAFVHEAHSWKDRPMRAVIGRVKIKPDRADEALAMIGDRGVAMLQGMAGTAGGYWARSLEGDIIQHSFWLFDTEENARAAEATFNQLRDMPDAPATFLSVDVCEIVGHAAAADPEVAAWATGYSNAPLSGGAGGAPGRCW